MNERNDRPEGPLLVGRPRDRNLDASILTAAWELLTEVGYQKTTITAIARRAGVGTPAIYRRWSTKESIIEDAVFGTSDSTLPTISDNLHDDILAWTRWFLNQIAEPATRSAIPGLLSAYQQTDGAYTRLTQRSEAPARAAFTERLRAEFPDRDPDAITEASDAVFDLLVASMIVRGLTVGHDDAGEFCTRTTKSLVLLVHAHLSE